MNQDYNDYCVRAAEAAWSVSGACYRHAFPVPFDLADAFSAWKLRFLRQTFAALGGKITPGIEYRFQSMAIDWYDE